MTNEYVLIRTTFPSRRQAEDAAAELVRLRLVACAQVGGPMTSTYRWQGAVESAEEWTCTLKTRRDRFEAVAAALTELHPYDVPEIVAVPIVAGTEAYLRWIDASLDGSG